MREGEGGEEGEAEEEGEGEEVVPEGDVGVVGCGGCVSNEEGEDESAVVAVAVGDEDKLRSFRIVAVVVAIVLSSSSVLFLLCSLSSFTPYRNLKEISRICVRVC